MTPRPDIVGVRTDATKREAAVVFSNSGFSRLPVYRGDMDHIVGVLYQKDLVRCMEDAGATLVGAGIVIEKAFQPGGDMIRARGIRLESLARVKSMNEETGVEFVD